MTFGPQSASGKFRPLTSLRIFSSELVMSAPGVKLAVTTDSPEVEMDVTLLQARHAEDGILDGGAHFPGDGGRVALLVARIDENGAEADVREQILLQLVVGVDAGSQQQDQHHDGHGLAAQGQFGQEGQNYPHRVVSDRRPLPPTATQTVTKPCSSTSSVGALARGLAR